MKTTIIWKTLAFLGVTKYFYYVHEIFKSLPLSWRHLLIKIPYVCLLLRVYYGLFLHPNVCVRTICSFQEVNGACIFMCLCHVFVNVQPSVWEYDWRNDSLYEHFSAHSYNLQEWVRVNYRFMGQPQSTLLWMMPFSLIRKTCWMTVYSNEVDSQIIQFL